METIIAARYSFMMKLSTPLPPPQQQQILLLLFLSSLKTETNDKSPIPKCIAIQTHTHAEGEKNLCFE
jgi:hypothetical protein